MDDRCMFLAHEISCMYIDDNQVWNPLTRYVLLYLAAWDFAG